MHKKISKLRDEHTRMKGFLSMIERSINNDNLSLAARTLNKFKTLWNEHERKEEKLFGDLASSQAFFPESMIVDEHRELKGHWKVLQNALSATKDKFRVALDTDGRMLIDKFRAHMDREDKLLSSAQNN